MRPSAFNLRVPLPDGDVFLMNTLTDAQLIVSRDVVGAARPRRRRRPGARRLVDADEREALDTARGATASSSRPRRRARGARRVLRRRSASDTSQLRVTVLTTLQCNFACDYCFQGDHGDYNRYAEKMSLETAARVGDWIERELDARRGPSASC